jgi:hypothetical protein
MYYNHIHYSYLELIYDNIIIRSKHVHCRSPFLFAFRPRSNIGTDKSAAYSPSPAQPYSICTRVIYLTQTHFMWSIHTENQLVPFLKSLV